MSELRALVVDDSPAMRKSILYALQRVAGLTCVEAQDGADGLKKFTQQKFDVILTDINMPLMDGLKLIHHVRANPLNQALPIVVITTESAEEDRQRAIHLGANAYLVKPVQARDVVQTVKDLLRLG